MKTFVTFLLSIITFVVSAQGTAYTLEECVLIALDKNISIKQSELDLEGASIDKDDAIGNFMPRLSLQSQHIWNNGLSQNITNGLIENLTTQFSSFGGNIGVTVFNGRQNINQLSRANLSIIARQYQLDDMKDDISLFVANAYLQVMFNKELAQVQRYQMELTQEDLERTKSRIEAGVLTKADIYEIEANLASQEQALIQADNNYRLSLISLAQLLLITDYENFNIAAEDFDIPFSDVLMQKPKDIFEKALGFGKEDILAQQILLAFVNLIFTFVAMFTVDKFGRKPLLYIGSIGMIVGFLLLGITLQQQSVGFLSLLGVLIFIASFALSMGPH